MSRLTAARGADGSCADARFWEWEVRSAANAAEPQRHLGAACVRTHEAADDVLCVRVSADGKFVAAALLDSTIQACDWPPAAQLQ